MSIEPAVPAPVPVLPYGRQWLDDDDIGAVLEVLKSDWLTTGPHVTRFERALAEFAGVNEAVVVSNGTAALHAAVYALGVGPGDEVIVPTMTFAASANCAVYQGATPVFVDVEAETLLIDPTLVEKKITARTKAIVAVDYAGQPCAYDALKEVAAGHNLPILADACHALGGTWRGRPVGGLGTLSTFSFHPVKPITTGEGGAVLTDDSELARRVRLFRNHGISTDHRQREQAGSWFYEMVELGYNYRLNDIQCALGASQLRKLPAWVKRRQEIAHWYDEAFARLPGVEPLHTRADVAHARHLYVIQVGRRNEVYAALREVGIGVNVHYVPVHLHPFYRKTFGTGPGLCPVAEAAYERILSLPVFPRMSDADVARVIRAVEKATRAHGG